MSMKSIIAGLFLFFAAPTVLAQSALLDFSSTMVSFRANFTQTIYDSDSIALQESSGTVELLRPGRFRWTYTEPNSQVIVADGMTLWVYDEDIQQVTVQPQATTLGSAPIGLLSGQRSIESEFSITELGEENGLQWFELEPLVKDTDFHAIYIALDENGLSAMELRDNFDQATQIKFINFEENLELPDDRFSFVPPDDADVVGEMGTVGSIVEDAPEVEAPAGGVVTQSSEPLRTTDDSNVVQAPETNTVIDGEELQIQEIRQ